MHLLFWCTQRFAVLKRWFMTTNPGYPLSFLSYIYEPAAREERKIDGWNLSFPRHQNDDPPLSGPFACWRRRSGTHFSRRPYPCESRNLQKLFGSSGSGRSVVVSTEPDVWFTTTSSKHALLLKNLRSGVELHYVNSRLVPRATFLSSRYRGSRNRISYCLPRSQVEVQEFEIVMHAPEDTLDLVLP